MKRSIVFSFLLIVMVFVVIKESRYKVAYAATSERVVYEINGKVKIYEKDVPVFYDNKKLSITGVYRRPVYDKSLDIHYKGLFGENLVEIDTSWETLEQRELYHLGPFIPLRKFCESLGYEVLWDQESQTLTVPQHFSYRIGDHSVTKLSMMEDKMPAGRDFECYIDHGVLMVSISLIGEGLNLLSQDQVDGVRLDDTQQISLLPQIHVPTINEIQNNDTKNSLCVYVPDQKVILYIGEKREEIEAIFGKPTFSAYADQFDPELNVSRPHILDTYIYQTISGYKVSIQYGLVEQRAVGITVSVPGTTLFGYKVGDPYPTEGKEIYPYYTYLAVPAPWTPYYCYGDLDTKTGFYPLSNMEQANHFMYSRGPGSQKETIYGVSISIIRGGSFFPDAHYANQ